MPAAKKLSPARRRAKSTSAAAKPHIINAHKPTKPTSGDIHPPIDSIDSSTSNLAQPKTPPVIARPPLPMTVGPERMPSQVFTPILRTTYNSIWLKRLGIMASALAILGLGAAGWVFRAPLADIITGSERDRAGSVTHLEISPTPTPDISKINQISSNASPQSSASANFELIVDQASSTAQLAAILQNESAAELKKDLSRYIEDLQQLQVNTNNLEAYQAKVKTLEDQGQGELAQKWLVEALMHAHELAILNGYYQQNP